MLITKGGHHRPGGSSATWLTSRGLLAALVVSIGFNVLLLGNFLLRPCGTTVGTSEAGSTRQTTFTAIPANPQLPAPSTPSSLAAISISTPSISPALAPPHTSTGLMVVILSATRPGGVDHVTPLSHLLVRSGVVDRIAVYDADVVSMRSFPWIDDVVRGPADYINSKVDAAVKNIANDKHHDPESRVRWRSHNALDYAFAMEHAYNLRHQYPLVLTMEDDVWPSADFADRLREVIQWRQSPWWGWALFHCRTFDSRQGYRNGDPFEFHACTQAQLYRTADLGPFISYTKANYAEDPFDWITRNYQYDYKLRMNVAIPSIVQHVGGGAGSTLTTKASESPKVGCWAFDYTSPAPTPDSSVLAARLTGVATPNVVQLSPDTLPPQPKIRDRTI